MSQSISADGVSATPRTLRPASLWKRAIVGLLVLTVGVFAAAWLLHSSIDEATALGKGTVAESATATSTREAR